MTPSLNTSSTQRGSQDGYQEAIRTLATRPHTPGVNVPPSGSVTLGERVTAEIQQLQRDTASLDQLLRLQFESPDVKKTRAFGLKLVKDMWAFVSGSTAGAAGGGSGNAGYYQERYTQWTNNDQWAKGTAPMDWAKNLMGVEGNKMWVDLDWHVLKIVPRYVQSLTNRFMSREEKPTVKATDIASERFRQREKLLARWRMVEKEKIKRAEAATGMRMEDGFTPEDEDELDVFYKIEYRIPDEAFFEDVIWQVFQNSGGAGGYVGSGYEYLKRVLIQDLIKKNIAMTKLERRPGMGDNPTLSNRLVVRRVDPMNAVYNIFKNADGSDVTIAGEARPIKISDARRIWPKVPEKHWFLLAQVARKGLNQTQPLNWLDSYIYSFNRPYDDYSFMAFDFEVKVYDNEYYVIKPDADGAPIAVLKKGVPAPTNPNARVDVLGKFNEYQGVWAVGTEILLMWGVTENQLKPFQNGVDVFSSYSVVMPDADGYYVPSLLERGIPCVRQMILCGLKIQQMMMLMEPDNLAVDIANLHALDIGTGANLKPLQLMKVKLQTGKVFWDSTDVSGTGEAGGGGQIPYTNLPNSGNVAQINILIGLYNFWLTRLNDEWGENAESMGQPTSAKKSAKASGIASEAGQGATEYIYDHLVMLLEQNATKIGYSLWDMVLFESEDYKKMMQASDAVAQGAPAQPGGSGGDDHATQISSENGAITRPIIDTTFDINIDMVSGAAKRAELAEMVKESLDSKIIGMATAARLLDISNPKTAILYLEKMEKRAKKEARAMQKFQIEMNAKAQQQSTQIHTQGKIAEEQAKLQAKLAIEALKGNNAAYSDLVRMVSDVEQESEKSGRQLPPDIAALKQYIVASAVKVKEAQGAQAAQAQQGQGQDGQAPAQQQGAQQP
jgi:hypothetical protein